MEDRTTADARLWSEVGVVPFRSPAESRRAGYWQILRKPNLIHSRSISSAVLNRIAAGVRSNTQFRDTEIFPHPDEAVGRHRIILCPSRAVFQNLEPLRDLGTPGLDRKSTRLNSSH